MIKPVFADGQIYHVYNRGVEKRDVFLDSKDYLRFVHDLYEFNDVTPTRNAHYFFNRGTNTVEHRKINGSRGSEPLVEVLVFALMPNHFHLMLRQRVDQGIVKFMQKLGTGYTMYFNKKYTRVGSLFQGRFKAVHITDDESLMQISHYIHSNPLALNYRGSTSIELIEYLMSYKWSSFPDYVGKLNFPSVTERHFLLDVFGGEDSYRRHAEQRLVEINEPAADIKALILDYRG